MIVVVYDTDVESRIEWVRLEHASSAVEVEYIVSSPLFTHTWSTGHLLNRHTSHQIIRYYQFILYYNPAPPCAAAATDNQAKTVVEYSIHQDFLYVHTIHAI